MNNSEAVMDMEKNWRDAKPKWAVEQAEAEIAGMKRRLALRWPDVARPMAVDFRWGAYDALTGSPRAGEYFFHTCDGHVYSVEIREKLKDEAGWKPWRFRVKSLYGDKWTDSVVRGLLYLTEEDARLAALWDGCDKAANELEKLWDKVIRLRGYV